MYILVNRNKIIKTIFLIINYLYIKLYNFSKINLIGKLKQTETKYLKLQTYVTLNVIYF